MRDATAGVDCRCRGCHGVEEVKSCHGLIPSGNQPFGVRVVLDVDLMSVLGGTVAGLVSLASASGCDGAGRRIGS